jgi:RNA polymerase sigma factor (sigma-70 family)
MTPRHLLEPARLAGRALLKGQSDARLVDMTRAGNDRAFEAIVGRYKGDLLRYCSRILPDGRSEDAVQQVFVNAYKALHSDTTPLSLRSWLFGIAHNTSLNILRQRGRDNAPLEAHLGTEEPAHVTLERRERVREVLAAVAALPPGQRDALLLRELEGRGHDEIARELGVTGGAARQLISRARNGIRSAAAAVLPMPLLMRLTTGTGPSPTTERLAELTAVGGGATVAKVVATVAVGGALLGGAVETENFVRDRSDTDTAEAASEPRDAGGSSSQGQVSDEQTGSRQDDAAQTGGDGGDDGDSGNADDIEGSGDTGSGDRSGPSGDDDGAGEDDESDSGPGGGDDDPEDDHSGPGDGDDGELDDSSGPGSDGTDTLETDNSGPGSGSDDTSETDSSGSDSGSDDTSETDSSGSDSGSSGSD